MLGRDRLRTAPTVSRAQAVLSLLSCADTGRPPCGVPSSGRQRTPQRVPGWRAAHCPSLLPHRTSPRNRPAVSVRGSTRSDQQQGGLWFCPRSQPTGSQTTESGICLFQGARAVSVSAVPSEGHHPAKSMQIAMPAACSTGSSRPALGLAASERRDPSQVPSNCSKLRSSLETNRPKDLHSPEL